MAGHATPHFHNDAGHPSIEIGVKRFMCVGANAPFDHPHEFLDMGDDDEIVCPYCSTLFRHKDGLGPYQSEPEGCTFDTDAG